MPFVRTPSPYEIVIPHRSTVRALARFPLFVGWRIPSVIARELDGGREIVKTAAAVILAQDHLTRPLALSRAPVRYGSASFRAFPRRIVAVVVSMKDGEFPSF